MADCKGTGERQTARLVTRISGTVFTVGDNVQGRGRWSEFTDCYAPTWGRFKNRTRPAAGNHEYYTSGAFGSRAGRPGLGYYSYDRGSWHVVVLNSNRGHVACGAGSRQLEWLKRDLAANRSRCTMAIFHHPLFTSSRSADTKAVRPFWKALYNNRAELILNGHAHSYERFAPQTPFGRRAPERGIRQFVVGTGGTPPLNPFGARPANSQVRNDKTLGVLRLTLRSGSYSWKCVPVAGKTFTDSGRGLCH